MGEGPESIGDKRNHLCEIARGEIIVFVDADDPSLPHRFATQLAALRANPEMMICGTSQYYCVDLLTGRAVEKNARSVWSGSLAFRKSAREDHPFDSGNECETNKFVEHYRDRTVDLRNRSLVVYTRHPFATIAPWAPIYGENEEQATRAVRELLGAQLDLYRAVVQPPRERVTPSA